MIGVGPCMVWLFCSSRSPSFHSSVHRPSRVETLLPARKKGGQPQSNSSPGKKENSKGETAKAFAIVADKLKESEKTIEYEKKLDNIIQRLGVIAKSLDQSNQASAAALKESKFQFTMRYAG